MQRYATQIIAAALLTFPIFAQQPSDTAQDRTFRFVRAETAQDQQEITTVIRSIVEIREAAVDTSQRKLTLRGTSAQIAAAEWLFNELDGAPSSPPGAREYKMPELPENVVRVFYPRNLESVQQLQELTTLIRSTLEIRRAFTYNAPRAVILRATAEQIGAAEWLIARVPVSAADSSRLVLTNPPENVVRVFHLSHAATVRDVQEVATVVRSTAEMRRMFTYNATKAIAVRGTEEQIALAAWLIGELDKPLSGTTDAGEYRVPSGTDDLVRVYYLPQSTTPERLQEVATQVRRTTEARRLFTYRAPRAMVMRGTADQIARAAELIRDAER